MERVGKVCEDANSCLFDVEAQGREVCGGGDNYPVGGVTVVEETNKEA